MITVRDFKQLLRSEASSLAGWRSLAPLIAWSLLIFILSSVPGNQYPQVSWNLADKVVHFSLYFVLGCFASLCFVSRGFGWWAPVFYGLLYGLIDELHQILVPLRSPSISDWYADAAGITAGTTAFWLLIVYLSADITNKSKPISDSAESMELM